MKLTVDGWAGLVATKMLWWAWGRVQSWWALRAAELWWHAMSLWWFLWRRCQSRATLGSATRHDAAKEVAGSMANLWWLRLRRAVVLRVLAGSAASLNFTL